MKSLPTPVVSHAERSLSAIEKFFYLLNQNHPNHFAMVGEVTGPTRIEQWQSALDRVARHSHIIWSRIERDGNGVPVFRAVPHGSIPLKVVQYDASKWKEEVAAQVAQPFDELHPPLLRATLLHSAARSIIVLVAHHSIGDGLSLTFLLGDVLRVVAGQDVVRSQETRAVEHLIELGHGMPKVDAAAQAAQDTSTPMPPPVKLRQPDGSAPHVEVLRLSSRMTQSLRERARAERTSVQSALIAAFTSAMSALAPNVSKDPLRVLSPVDLRRRLLDESDHLGVCVSAVVSADDGPRHADLWSNARNAGEAFAGLESPEILAERVLTAHGMLDKVNATAEAQAVFAQAFGYESVVTNLGVLDLPRQFGPLVLDAVWGPSVAVGIVGEQVIGATTFNDRLHLVHTSYEPVPGLLDQMAADITVALTEVVQ